MTYIDPQDNEEKILEYVVKVKEYDVSAKLTYNRGFYDGAVVAGRTATFGARVYKSFWDESGKYHMEIIVPSYLPYTGSDYTFEWSVSTDSGNDIVAVQNGNIYSVTPAVSSDGESYPITTSLKIKDAEGNYVRFEGDDSAQDNYEYVYECYVENAYISKSIEFSSDYYTHYSVVGYPKNYTRAKHGFKETRNYYCAFYLTEGKPITVDLAGLVTYTYTADGITSDINPDVIYQIGIYGDPNITSQDNGDGTYTFSCDGAFKDEGFYYIDVYSKDDESEYLGSYEFYFIYLDKNNHGVEYAVTDPYVAPTCTETGLTEGSHCSECGATMVAQEVVPATGHTWDEGVVTKEATALEEGLKVCTCSVCQETKEEVLPKLEVIQKWYQLNGDWYYFDANGVVTTGWQKVNHVWYYMDESGIMTTGWQKVDGIWYYMNASGAMKTGWQQVDGTWYYFYSSGAMASNIWIGNYYVNASGVWTKSK